jgi:hypothetical protein
MAVEALTHLGIPETVDQWVRTYLDRLDAAPDPAAPLDPTAWREHLGHPRRYPGWLALFERELRERSWGDVVRTWVPRLMPGHAAAASHGLIRVGHAVRALAATETAPRRAELACGLAYWASSYGDLPGAVNAAGTLSLADALAAIPRRVPVDGFFSTAIEAAAADPAFGPAVDAVAAVTLDELVPLFVRVYLANTDQAVALVHAVTAPFALGQVLPYLDADDRSGACALVWQSSAAFASAFGENPPSDGAAGAVPTIAEIAEGAIANGDEHVIKFADACVSEHVRLSDDVLLVAAADVAARI